MPTVTDSFTYSDGPLPSPWALSSAELPQLPAVLSNKAMGSGTGIGAAYYSTFPMSGPTQSASVTVSTLPVGYVGVMLCHDSAAGSGYSGWWTSDAGGKFELYSMTGGAYSAMSTVAGSLSAGQVSAVSYNRGLIELSADGVVKASATNLLYSGGYPGIVFNELTARLDDFSATYAGSQSKSGLLMQRRGR